MINTANTIYTFLDLVGTFVFALSGAVAAKQKGLDVFGIFSMAFTVVCGGGIIRDLCIGAIPPAGLTNWLYLVMVFAATARLDFNLITPECFFVFSFFPEDISLSFLFIC